MGKLAWVILICILLVALALLVNPKIIGRMTGLISTTTTSTTSTTTITRLSPEISPEIACERLAMFWCLSCKTHDWTNGPEPSTDLRECAENYFSELPPYWEHVCPCAIGCCNGASTFCSHFIEVQIATATTIPVVPSIIGCDFDIKINEFYGYITEGQEEITMIVNLTARYMGNKEETYTYDSDYSFKSNAGIGDYYEPEPPSTNCEFEIGTVMPGDKITGCLEFKVFSSNRPHLLFHDKKTDETCCVSLPEPEWRYRFILNMTS